VVESDETYIGGSDKNKHAKKRVRDEFGNPVRSEKAAVMGMVERGGNVIVQHVKTIDESAKDTFEFVVTKNVSQEATLVTDQHRGYFGMSKYYEHLTVDHTARQYVDGMAHTNTIEGFWSQMKRGIDGIYHWISVKHLQSYAEEFAFRYNTPTLSESGRFNLVLATW
jgi:hypothetical protein